MNIIDIYVLIGLYLYIIVMPKLLLINNSYSVWYFKFTFIMYLFIKFLIKPEPQTLITISLVLLYNEIYETLKYIFDIMLDFIIINIQWIFWIGLIYSIFSIDNKIN